MENVTEVNRVMLVVDETRFDTMPEHWRYCGGYEAGRVDRVGPGADFLYYNIYTDRAITNREAYHLAHRTLDEIPMVICAVGTTE